VAGKYAGNDEGKYAKCMPLACGLARENVRHWYAALHVKSVRDLPPSNARKSMAQSRRRNAADAKGRPHATRGHAPQGSDCGAMRTVSAQRQGR
jgi:hypothetical protein